MGERRVIPGHPGAAAFAGAFAAGVPGWIVTALLQPVVHADRPPDGFNGLSDAGELFVGHHRPSDFGFYGNDGSFIVETGRIDVYAGNSSARTCGPRSP